MGTEQRLVCHPTNIVIFCKKYLSDSQEFACLGDTGEYSSRSGGAVYSSRVVWGAGGDVCCWLNNAELRYAYRLDRARSRCSTT